MLRRFVLNSPVQFTIGRDYVLIPAQQFDPPGPPLDGIECTQEDLAPGGGNWGDDEVISAAQASLEAKYVGDTIEVLTADQFAAENAGPEPEIPVDPE